MILPRLTDPVPVVAVPCMWEHPKEAPSRGSSNRFLSRNACRIFLLDDTLLICEPMTFFIRHSYCHTNDEDDHSSAEENPRRLGDGREVGPEQAEDHQPGRDTEVPDHLPDRQSERGAEAREDITPHLVLP